MMFVQTCIANIIINNNFTILKVVMFPYVGNITIHTLFIILVQFFKLTKLKNLCHILQIITLKNSITNVDIQQRPCLDVC